MLSSILNIPLIVTEEKTFRLAQQFYPDLNVTLYDLNDLTMEFLAKNYDLIFQTGKFWAAELGPFMELLFQKKMRFVFCPHGNSDKGHSLQNHVEQDIFLVMGVISIRPITADRRRAKSSPHRENWKLPLSLLFAAPHLL